MATDPSLVSCEEFPEAVSADIPYLSVIYIPGPLEKESRDAVSHPSNLYQSAMGGGLSVTQSE